jgi:hypothetical protein
MKTVTAIDETPLPPIRHCERSEAIHVSTRKHGLLRRFAPRNDDGLDNIPLPNVNASAIIEL